MSQYSLRDGGYLVLISVKLIQLLGITLYITCVSVFQIISRNSIIQFGVILIQRFLFCFLFCVFHPFVFSRDAWLTVHDYQRCLQINPWFMILDKKKNQENGQLISLTFADITIKASRIHMETVCTIFTCSCQHFNYCLPFCTERRQIFYSPSPWWDVI